MADESCQPLVIGIGEVLWDMLPGGKQLGGAPANFAYHARALGAAACPVSRVGDDALGREILDRLVLLDLPTTYVGTDRAHPTGTVDVRVDPGGVPHYVIHEHVAWDFLEPAPELLALAARADAICFGTLAQRSTMSRETIRAVLDAANRPGCLRVFDINLRQHYHTPRLVGDLLERSDVLKLNDEELPAVMRMLDLPAAGNATQQLAQLAGAGPGLRLVALTRGRDGSILFTRQRVSDHPGVRPERIADTVGAGDAFTAAVVTGMLRGDDLDMTNAFANRLAAYVCTQPGATPPIPAELVASRGASASPSMTGP